MAEQAFGGEVVYLYAFDVAGEIKTARVQEILSEKAFPYGIRMDRSLPKDLPLYRPLAVELPPSSQTVHGRPVRLQVRVYDVGVVSIAVRVAFEGFTFRDLIAFHDAKLDSGVAVDWYALDLCREVLKGLAELLVNPTEPQTPEAYTVFCLTDLGGAEDTAAWLADNGRQVAALLTETTDPSRLSVAQVQETLKVQVSFERSDLVVVDWDAALAVDLDCYIEDVLYVLELANLQLEELHAIDAQLDGHLDRAYGIFEDRRIGRRGINRSILARLRELRVDFTKLTDQIDHISKFVGDWYLARVYMGARDRFHLKSWRDSVENRLSQLDRLYSVLRSEVDSRWMLVLEAMIVALFVIDLAALFLLKK